MFMPTATAHAGLVTVDGRDYATPAAWAAITEGTSTDQVRRAAMLGRLDGAIPVSPGGKVKAYPIDVLADWEAWRRSGQAPKGHRSAGDMSTVAERCKVTKMRVWRAVKAGLITAVQDRDGVWQLDEGSVNEWIACGMPAPRGPGHG